MVGTLVVDELHVGRSAGRADSPFIRGDAMHAISEIQQCIDERAWGAVRVLLCWRRKVILANASDAGAVFLEGVDKILAEERERDPHAHWARPLPPGVIWSNAPLQR